jgi:hypothetical protein
MPSTKIEILDTRTFIMEKLSELNAKKKMLHEMYVSSVQSSTTAKERLDKCLTEIEKLEQKIRQPSEAEKLILLPRLECIKEYILLRKQIGKVDLEWLSSYTDHNDTYDGYYPRKELHEDPITIEVIESSEACSIVLRCSWTKRHEYFNFLSEYFNKIVD